MYGPTFDNSRGTESSTGFQLGWSVLRIFERLCISHESHQNIVQQVSMYHDFIVNEVLCTDKYADSILDEREILVIR